MHKFSFFILLSLVLHSYLDSSVEILEQTLIVEVAKVQELAIHQANPYLSISSENVDLGERIHSSNITRENTYDYTSLSQKPQKITALLSNALPKGYRLKVHLQAPTGAQSLGFVDLNDQTPMTLVQHIPAKTCQRGLSIQVQLLAAHDSKPQLSEVQVIYKLEDEN